MAPVVWHAGTLVEKQFCVAEQVDMLMQACAALAIAVSFEQVDDIDPMVLVQYETQVCTAAESHFVQY